MNTISTEKDASSPSPFVRKFSSPFMRGLSMDKSADFLLDNSDSPYRDKSFNTSKIFLFNLESPTQLKKLEIPEVETENTPPKRIAEALKSHHNQITDSAVQGILEKPASRINQNLSSQSRQRDVESVWSRKNTNTEEQKANSHNREIKTFRAGSSEFEDINFNIKKSSGYNSARFYFQQKNDDIISQNVPEESQSIILDVMPDMKGDQEKLAKENPEINSLNLVHINQARSDTNNNRNQLNHQNSGELRESAFNARRLNSILPLNPLQIENIQAEYLNDFPEQLYKILANLAKYHMRRSFAFCIALALLFSFLADTIGTPQPSFRNALLVCYAFIVYMLIENIILTKNDTILRWKKIENICITFDIATIILLVGAIDLKVSGFILPTKILLAPLLANFFFYVYKTEAPKRIKGLYCKVRIGYSVQFLLLILKLDGDIDWTWQVVILFAWPVLAYVSLYGLVNGAMFISALSKCIKRIQTRNQDNTVLVIGYLWATMYSSIGVLVFAVIIKLSTKGGEYDRKLEQYMIAGRYMSAVVGAFTLVTTKKLKNFFVTQNTDTQDYVEELQRRLYLESTVPKVRKENVQIFLVKLSSTYFTSLQESFYFKNKESLQDLRKSMRQLKRTKSHIQHSKSKEEFGKTLSKDLKMQIVIAENIEKINKMQQLRQKVISNLRNNSVSNVDEDRQASILDDFESSKQNKLCLSEGDEVQIWEKKVIKNEQNEDSCYICYSNPRDAVLAPCGHGGVCVDCAVEIMKAHGQCMECRQKVEAVVRIDLVPKLKNIVKAYEVITFNSLR